MVKYKEVTRMMKELEIMERNIWNEAKKLAQESHKRYCRNIHERLYLYINNKELKIAPDSTWKLAESESIPRHYTVDGLMKWFHERLRRLPIL